MSETLKSVEFADNFKDIEWVKQQVFAELKSLKNNINQNDNLFIKEGGKEGGKEFDVDLAKNYLDSIKNKTRSELSEKNASAWTMSVQISLESLGHDVGKIDGVFGPKTKNAITDFQNKWNNENSNDEILVDGLAGKATIDRILKKLNNSTIESTDSSKGKELFDKLKQSNEILTDIKKQYTLPELNRYAEVKNDYVSTTASTKVILTSKNNGKDVKISFDKEANNLKPTAQNIYSPLAETNYTNPTLISGQDSFELKENIVLPGTTAKTEITLLPKKEAATTNKTKTPINTPSQKSKKEQKKEEVEQETVLVEPVVVTIPEIIENPIEETETLGLTGTELEKEDYNNLEGKLIGIKDGDEVKLLTSDLLALQGKTKTKVFSFESANQKMIEQMLAPVIIATGDMPKESVEKLINKEDTGCVSYSISDIAETLNVILKEENPDEQYINTKYFKQFCKYLFEKNMIKFEDGKYIDNPQDGNNFINVLFIEELNNTDNNPELSIKEDGKGKAKNMDANEAMHELRHAEFETIIAKNTEYLKEFRDFFYGKDILIENITKQTERVNIVKGFLNEIYIKYPEIPYKWHFNKSGSTIEEKKTFINSIDYSKLKELDKKTQSNDNYLIKRKIPLEGGGNIGTAEFNLLTEFWAFSREQNPTVNLGDHKFSWEEGYVATEQINIENNDSQEILSTINTKYEIAGNNDNIIKELKAEKTIIGDSNAIKLTGKIGNKDVSILLDSEGNNPRLVRGDETLNLYEIPTANSNKNKIVVVPDSVVVLEKFLNYKDNLVIGNNQPIKDGKFDFSETDKVTIVFKKGNNEIRINFNNDGTLLENQKIKIIDDNYKVSISNNKIKLDKVSNDVVSGKRLEETELNQNYKDFIDNIEFNGDDKEIHKTILKGNITNSEVDIFIKEILKYNFSAKNFMLDTDGYGIIFSSNNGNGIKLKELKELEETNKKISIALPEKIDKTNNSQLINKFKLKLVI